MFCPYCGSKVKNDLKICPNCNNPLTDDVETTANEEVSYDTTVLTNNAPEPQVTPLAQEPSATPSEPVISEVNFTSTDSNQDTCYDTVLASDNMLQQDIPPVSQIPNQMPNGMNDMNGMSGAMPNQIPNDMNTMNGMNGPIPNQMPAGNFNPGNNGFMNQPKKKKTGLVIGLIAAILLFITATVAAVFLIIESASSSSKKSGSGFDGTYVYKSENELSGYTITQTLKINGNKYTLTSKTVYDDDDEYDSTTKDSGTIERDGDEVTLDDNDGVFAYSEGTYDSKKKTITFEDYTGNDCVFKKK